MIFLRKLGVGDCFRPAHPKQASVNRRVMDRGAIYRIDRVFTQSPGLFVCSAISPPGTGVFSLPPGALVLRPNEPLPTEEEVLDLLWPNRVVVTGYRMLWDGNLEDLRILKGLEADVLKIVFAFCDRTTSMREIRRVVGKYRSKSGGGISEAALRPTLANLAAKGLVEQIVDFGPIPQAIADANLQTLISELVVREQGIDEAKQQ